MKIFISFPMYGMSNRELRKVYNQYKRELSADYPEAEFIDSIIDLGKEATALDYIAESIRMIKQADIVFFGRHWEATRGCRVEHMVAEEYGKAIREEIVD